MTATDYVGLVLPGGVANPDFLRLDAQAVGCVRAVFEQGKPVAVICHGPWTLVEADVVPGRTLTSWPLLQTDIRKRRRYLGRRGGRRGQGRISSLTPDDLPAFCAKLVEEFSEGRHVGQRSSVGAARQAGQGLLGRFRPVRNRPGGPRPVDGRRCCA